MSCSDKMTVDPLLKDLDEKKESFRRNVVSLATELKQMRGRLVSQEQSFLKETLTRKEAEKRGKNMEMEMCKLQNRLEERNLQLQASASAADKFIKDLEELRSHLDETKQTAETSADSAQSTQIQCSSLKKQLADKTRSLKEHEDRMTQLAHQLDDLQRDMSLRECSEKQLRGEVKRIEREITEAIAKGGIGGTDCMIQKLVKDVSSFEKVNKLVEVKDEQITKLKDEIRLMSGHWKHKTKELESQLEKQRRTDQDLKKKVLKLEFCLQEARSQTRKLQRKGERRDMEIKEIRDLISEKQQQQLNNESWDKQKFWDNSGFKIVVSMSMLILVVVSKR